jgi:hypothetical protein
MCVCSSLELRIDTHVNGVTLHLITYLPNVVTLLPSLDLFRSWHVLRSLLQKFNLVES